MFPEYMESRTIKTNNWMNNYYLYILFVIGLLNFGCQPDPVTLEAEIEESITFFVKRTPEYSEFTKLIERSGFEQFFKLAGTYTVFIPTNEAFEKYYQTRGVSGLDDPGFSTNELKLILQEHVLDDTIPSSDFEAGRLSVDNFNGNFMVLDVESVNDTLSYAINRVTLGKRDKRLINGIMHEVNNVIVPLTGTLSEYFDQNESYKIFTEAMRRTALIDSISKTGLGNVLTDVELTKADSIFFTVFAIPDDMYNQEGINSFADLVKWIDPADDNYTDEHNAVHEYVGFHIIKGFSTVSDFYDGKYATFSYPILINNEIGVRLNYAGDENSPMISSINLLKSNDLVGNGVVHELNNVLQVLESLPAHDTLTAQHVVDRNWLLENKYRGIVRRRSTFVSTSGSESSNVTSVSYSAVSVDDYILVQGPALLDIKYDVYYTGQREGSAGGGDSRVKMKINGKDIGSSFINEPERTYVGEVQIDNRGYARIQIILVALQPDVDNNRLGLAQIEFVPVL